MVIKMNKPEQKFRAGSCTATVWKNKTKKDGEEREYETVTFEKSYKDGEEWKTSKTLVSTDIPKAILVLSKAHEFIILKTQEESVA